MFSGELECHSRWVSLSYISIDWRYTRHVLYSQILLIKASSNRSHCQFIPSNRSPWPRWGSNRSTRHCSQGHQLGLACFWRVPVQRWCIPRIDHVGLCSVMDRVCNSINCGAISKNQLLDGLVGFHVSAGYQPRNPFWQKGHLLCVARNWGRHWIFSFSILWHVLSRFVWYYFGFWLPQERWSRDGRERYSMLLFGKHRKSDTRTDWPDYSYQC